MGHGYKHGGTGGGSLNFNVKSYPSEVELKADKPRENTIGVITTTTITSWVFSAKEPSEPEVGMVWFSVGKESSVEFNALKNNTLKVYPLTANQYIGDKFEEKTAFSYQGSEWCNWIKYLFNYGKVGNSWSASNMRGTTASNTAGKAPTIKTNADGSVDITLTNGSDSFTAGCYKLDEAIDFTDISALSISVVGIADCFYFGLYIVPVGADAWTADTTYGGDAVAYLFLLKMVSF